MLAKIFKQILRKKLSSGIILVLIIIGGYFAYQELTKDNSDGRYITAAVEKDTLIVSVSGSGQVSALDQIDIKSKVKGDIESLYIEKGEEIKAGELIVKLDDTDFQKAVEEAEISLETVKLELEELLSPADELTLLKSENSVLQAKNSLEKLKLSQEKEYQNALESIKEAEKDIERAYEDTLNTVTDVFWDLPTVITGARNILYSYEIGESEITVSAYQWNKSVYSNFFDGQDRGELEPFIKNAEDSYKKARENYDQNFENYKETSYYSERETIEDLLNETIETVKSTAQAVKDEANLIGFVIDYLFGHDRRIYKKITDYQSDLKTYTSKINSHYSSLLSIQRSLEDSRKAKIKAKENLTEIEKTHPLDLEAAEIGLQEKEKSLAELKAGPDELDIRAKENSLRQKEDALFTAEKDLANCNIFSPSNGIITEINIEKGDSVSAGSALVTLITKQKIAEMTLNEIDIAKVKTGQKSTLTFDAVEDLTITGEVIEVDNIGTVTQGVVTYGVKIAFDTQDERIKPGMSLSAAIITDIKQNALVISSSAIKQQGDMVYVQVTNNIAVESNSAAASISGTFIPASDLHTQQVQVGLSNDTMAEITDGLKEGDIIIVQTISSNATQNQSQRDTEFNPNMMRMIR